MGALLPSTQLQSNWNMGNSDKYTMCTQNSHQSVAGMLTKAKTNTWRFPLVDRLMSMWLTGRPVLSGLQSLRDALLPRDV